MRKERLLVFVSASVFRSVVVDQWIKANLSLTWSASILFICQGRRPLTVRLATSFWVQLATLHTKVSLSGRRFVWGIFKMWWRASWPSVERLLLSWIVGFVSFAMHPPSPGAPSRMPPALRASLHTVLAGRTCSSQPVSRKPPSMFLICSITCSHTIYHVKEFLFFVSVSILFISLFFSLSRVSIHWFSSVVCKNFSRSCFGIYFYLHINFSTHKYLCIHFMIIITMEIKFIH